ncbi:Rcs stress response system protein RcsF [Thalassotalea psychrophila]|uniref:Rcs stress response system protein RcsF n=1 Tax=Thalassotalea psychrophila TaxID=3065647 RepID=A0ABY9TPN1_9GAMM|nr:Rcs stress response system protein RcsF [Colwelliaceae bacterium SQ149]
MKIISIKQIVSLLTISTVTLLSACANGPSVETNLDKENFDEYFAAGNVTVYQTEDELPGKVVSLGLIEGESCKAKENDIPANAADARTMAREKAASMEANAVVFTSCTLIEDQQCLEMMVCYGKAFQVSDH